MPIHIPEPGQGRLSRLFSRAATTASNVMGTGAAFTTAFLIILVWAASGPYLQYSDTWQLAINRVTTTVTFLMVFLIQHAQNKDTRVLHIKLNELIAAVDGASNRLIDLEDLSDEEIESLHKRFQALAKDAKRHAAGARTSVEAEKRGA
jgi:low affinity Fe/Cu permease